MTANIFNSKWNQMFTKLILKNHTDKRSFYSNWDFLILRDVNESYFPLESRRIKMNLLYNEFPGKKQDIS